MIMILMAVTMENNNSINHMDTSLSTCPNFLYIHISFFPSIKLKTKFLFPISHMPITYFIESTSSQATDTHPNSPSCITHNHIKYYLPGRDLFLLINSTLFHVHSYFFTCKLCFWHNLLGRVNRGWEANNPIDINIDVPFVQSHITPTTLLISSGYPITRISHSTKLMKRFGNNTKFSNRLGHVMGFGAGISRVTSI